jgi:tetratricopeptide (TPR) repeat protein
MATKDSERSLEPRLVLARAVARETICWESRPTHEHPGQDLEALTSATGVRIEADLDGPRRAVLRKKFETHRACLKDAATRFAAAEVAEDTRAEALTRGAFVLFLDGRAREASEKLAAVRPGNDRFVAYWTALFQGRVLGALGRAEQALQAYGRALDLYPGAQSASIGRALELSHLRRTDEVDAVSQLVRATSAEDPWLTYFKAEQRFIDQWLKDLRAVLR